MVPSSDDVSLGLDLPGRKTSVGEDVERQVRRLAGERLREQVADRGRLLKAVDREAACAPETCEVIHRTQYGLVIGGHLVQACPRGPDAGRRELWRSML